MILLYQTVVTVKIMCAIIVGFCLQSIFPLFHWRLHFCHHLPFLMPRQNACLLLLSTYHWEVSKPTAGRRV